MASSSIKGNLLLEAAMEMREALLGLRFAPPVHTVYHPLVYAWAGHAAYLQRFGAAPKRVVFLGMNPGPWGMAQTGVPFGEVSAVRDWMGIEAAIEHPVPEHPKRPIEGFDCKRSEVSGCRLWGLFARRYPVAEDFFRDHLVVNYCPLVWMEESGRNRTPNKLPKEEMKPVEAACHAHLREILGILRPDWAIGVGAYAEEKLRQVADSAKVPWKVLRIPHPSPASPAANKDWAGAAERALVDGGVWDRD